MWVGFNGHGVCGGGGGVGDVFAVGVKGVGQVCEVFVVCVEGVE